MSENQENAVNQDARREDANDVRHLAEVATEDKDVELSRQQGEHHHGDCRNEEADLGEVEGESLGIFAVVGIGDAGILHKGDAAADNPDGLGERDGVGEHAHTTAVDELVQEVVAEAKVEELHEMAGLVEETVLEQVLQGGFVVAVVILSKVGVFVAQHPDSQEERT